MELPRAEWFDVLLADLNLPGASGVELAQRAVEAHSDLRVIVASGDELPDTLLFDFPCRRLRKPYAIVELEDALRAIQFTSRRAGR